MSRKSKRKPLEVWVEVQPDGTTWDNAFDALAERPELTKKEIAEGWTLVKLVEADALAKENRELKRSLHYLKMNLTNINVQSAANASGCDDCLYVMQTSGAALSIENKKEKENE